MIEASSPDRRSMRPFRRYECKYLVSEHRAAQICRYIHPFVAVDPFAARSQDRSYDIQSLYLDDPGLRLFWATREGQANRLKLRIRDYGGDDKAKVFLEIKRRRNRLVLKERARLDKPVLQRALAGGSSDTNGLPASERACYERFMSLVAGWTARPLVWVKYRREAYVGSYNPGLRITFDRDLRCAPALSEGSDGPSEPWRPLENRRVVLELKFDAAFPDWIRRLVERFDLRQRSYSKYCYAVSKGVDSWALSASEAWSLPRS